MGFRVLLMSLLLSPSHREAVHLLSESKLGALKLTVGEGMLRVVSSGTWTMSVINKTDFVCVCQ